MNRVARYRGTFFLSFLFALSIVGIVKIVRVNLVNIGEPVLQLGCRLNYRSASVIHGFAIAYAALLTLKLFDHLPDDLVNFERPIDVDIGFPVRGPLIQGRREIRGDCLVHMQLLVERAKRDHCRERTVRQTLKPNFQDKLGRALLKRA